MRFYQYALYRILSLIVQILGALAVVFVLFNLLPDPIAASGFAFWHDPNAAEKIKKLRHEWRLDRSVFAQYYLFVYDLAVHHTMGKGWTLGQGGRVEDVIIPDFFISLQIFGTGFLLMSALSTVLAIYSAVKWRTQTDSILSQLFSFFYSVPSYVLAVILLFYFPEYGFRTWTAGTEYNLSEFIGSAFTPILVVIFAYSGFLFRQIRLIMIETLGQKYIVTARAKGLKERSVIIKHALRNALPRVLTSIAISFPLVLSGSIVLEVIFGIPGLGMRMVEKTELFDWSIIRGATLLYAFLVGVVMLVFDLLSWKVDPRRF